MSNWECNINLMLTRDPEVEGFVDTNVNVPCVGEKSNLNLLRAAFSVSLLKFYIS